MNFYQELQLDQVGSKAYIASLNTRKEKIIHIGIYLFKIILYMAFAVAFIGLYSAICGSENSIVGLVVLLFIMMFRFSDLDIKVSHSIVGIFLLFAILAAGPKVANMLPIGAAFLVNLVCILLIMIIGCHNTALFNHASMVLSYLLLLGADVSGHSYYVRLVGLGVGAVLTVAVFLHTHWGKTYQYSFKDLFLGFNLSTERTRWQLRMSISVSLVLLIASLLGWPKLAWSGIAAMSVCVPSHKLLAQRMKFRAPANILGSVLFLVIFFILPENTRGYIGYIGGICAGLSATYACQTMSNCISTLSIAASIYGPAQAIFLRVFYNILGSLSTFLLERVLEPAFLWINKRIGQKEYISDMSA